MAKHSIRTPTAGSLWAHSASVGQKVFQGNVIVIVEVMKTEWPIETPVDGVVTWLAACGDTLERDQLVAIIES